MIIRLFAPLLLSLLLSIAAVAEEEPYLCWGQGDVIENSYAADYVFAGKVVATRRLKPDMHELGTGRTKMLFHVEQAWKGIGEDDEFINVDVEDIYRYNFELKETYLVFAFKLHPGRVSIVGCPRVKPTRKAQKWVRRLGKPEMAFEVSDDVDFLPEEVIREYRGEEKKDRKRDSVIVVPAEPKPETEKKPAVPEVEPKAPEPKASPEAPKQPEPPVVELSPEDIFAGEADEPAVPSEVEVPALPDVPELDAAQPEIDVKVTVPDAPEPPKIEVTIPDMPEMPDVTVEVETPNAPDVSVEVETPELLDLPAFPTEPSIPPADDAAPLSVPSAPQPESVLEPLDVGDIVEDASVPADEPAVNITPEDVLRQQQDSSDGPSESAQEFLRGLPPLPPLPGRD